MGRTILIAAGGTGGHLFPGVAVADELRRREAGIRVVFVGTPRGLEGTLVPRAGYELLLLPVRPLKGGGLPGLLRGLLALPRALAQSFALVRRLRPDAVLGIGGYAGGPLVLAAALLGVKTVILEPNARPGFANRMLRPFVGRAACAYPGTERAFGRKGVLTGTPVRSGFRRGEPRPHAAPRTLLAFGGSQGSAVLNEALVAALPRLPGPDRLRIVHQTGPAQRDRVEAAYRALPRPGEVVAFLEDMDARMAEADLVLARSGATTCAELTAAGRAAVLVPFARSADDHQKANAAALQAAGAARMVEEAGLTGETLARALTELLEDPRRLSAMEAAASALGRPDAAERVADLLGPAPGSGVTACV